MAKGLLLINLGSPADTSVPAVRRYLNQFLTDPFVIDLPTPFRQILVRGIITPLRAPKSAEAYKKIWTAQGSPLVQFTRSFAEKVRATLASEFDVRWAMRYGEPSISSELKNWSVDELVVIPLYPQYAESSTRTGLDEVTRVLKGEQRPVKVLKDFFRAPEFIDAEVRLIQNHLNEFKPDHLLLSFHGLPEHHLAKLHPQTCFQTSDCCDQVSERNRYCYRAQCVATARGIAEKLDFASTRVSYSFQSRLGRRPWIKPYTDLVLKDLIAQGVHTLSVACPSFVCDCLETLEEIQMRLREQFIAEGGQELRLIPALNDSPIWVENFSQLVKREFQ